MNVSYRFVVVIEMLGGVTVGEKQQLRITMESNVSIQFLADGLDELG